MDFDPKKNYYDILGVSEDASIDEIKKAFKQLAIKHHPDRGGDTAKFQEINEAKTVLTDEQKKQQYDAYRKGGFGGFGGFGGGGGGFEVDLGDLMGGFFGGGGRSKSRTRRGEDIKVQIDVSFDEGFLGTKKKIKYSRRVMADGVEQDTCTVCDGKGATAQQAQTPFGVMNVQSTCRTCGGTGYIFKKDGKEVSNDGLEKQTETQEINIPAGIKDGVYIKFSNKGNAGIGGGPTGDLYVKINVKSSDKYERKGDDLYVKAAATLFDLVLGGTVEVPHPEGKIEVKIPKGTQIKDKIRVSKKGFGDSGIFNKKGDMYVIPTVHVPKKLSRDQEKLWKELQDKS